MHEVQARGFIGESFLDKVLWDLWSLFKYDEYGYVEGVLYLATVCTPDTIVEKIKIDLKEKIDKANKLLDYLKDKRQNYDPITRRKAERADIIPQLENVMEIEHALVNAYFEAGFLFRREEFRQRPF